MFPTKRILVLATVAATVATVASVAVAVAMPTAAEPARAQPPALDWRPCADHPANGAECATLIVPLDWSHPDGATISLALSRLRAADPHKRIGSLVVNPGGPGGAGAGFVEQASDVIPQQLRDEFDLVGFDPRGVGESRPAIACAQPIFDPEVTEFPANQAQFDRLVARNRALGADCLRHTGPLLAHVDTISVARDLEAIRAALGEDRLNFFGLSYGSLIGNIYARLYPGHLRAMVLDGPIDHTLDAAQMVADENATTEIGLRHFFAWCDRTTSCALHTDGAAATYARLLAMAARGPLPAAGIPGGSPGEVVRQGVYGLLIVTRAWPALAAAIQQAVTGDASALADAADNGPNSPDNPDNVTGSQAYVSIGCQDFGSNITTFDQFERQIEAARRAAPDVGGNVEAWLDLAGCIGWPVRAADPPRAEPVHGAPPILIVAGRFDPSTPLAWGVGLARQIGGSILLTRSSDGHTGLLNDACAAQREADYLTSPAAPVSPCP